MRRNLRQAVTILLCTAMMATSLPQTDMTVYATEPEEAVQTAEDTGSSDEGSSADADDADKDSADTINGDTEDGSSDIVGTEEDETTDQDTDTAVGESEEAEEQGGLEEENAEDAVEQPEDSEEAASESISINALDYSVAETEETEEESDYSWIESYCSTSEEDDWASLSIWDCAEEGILTIDDIISILKYYGENERSFNRISMDLFGQGGTATIYAELANAAREILCWDDEGEVYLAFCFASDDSYITWDLTNPEEFSKDITPTYSETVLDAQGVKVKFGGSIPAEAVYCNIYKEDSPYGASLNDGDSDLAILRLKDMVSANDCGTFYEEYAGDNENETHLALGDINTLQTGTEYLLTPIYVDSKTTVGETLQLTAGERSGEGTTPTNVKWFSYDTDIATIDSKGLLTAWEAGTCSYYVSYKVGSVSYLELHQMTVQEQNTSIAFDSDEVSLEIWTETDEEGSETKEYGRNYLSLCYNPSSAERDQGDPTQIHWESSNTSVVELVLYDEDGNETTDENSGSPNGEIRAVGEGTAVVWASLVWSDYDEGTGEESYWWYDVGNGSDTETAVCTITVSKSLSWSDIESEVNAMNLYAVTNLDTTLGDIELPTSASEGTWEWAEPETSLADYQKTEGHSFRAVYTKDGKSIECDLWVRMVTVTGVSIVAMETDEDGTQIVEVPDSVKQGDTLTLGRSYLIDNLDESEGSTEYQDVRDRMDEVYAIQWTSNPANIGETKTSDGLTDGLGNLYEYEASLAGTKAEKKTFTVAMVDNSGSKPKTIFQDSCKITVTAGDLYDFDSLDWWCGTDDDDSQMYWFLMVPGTAAEYNQQKLTVASEDTSILNLNVKKTIVEEVSVDADDDEDESDEKEETDENVYTLVKIPCQNLKPGTVWIKVTASDEMNSFRRYQWDFIDMEPKLIDVSSVTINKALEEEDRSVSVTVRVPDTCSITTNSTSLSSVSYQLWNGKQITSTYFGVTIEDVKSDDEDGTDYKITLTPNDNALTVMKTGGKLGLNLTVKENAEETEETITKSESDETEALSRTYTLTIPVTIVNTVPTVKFKQTQKVNLFYTDNEGYGTLTITGAAVSNLKLADTAKGSCDYTLVSAAEEETASDDNDGGLTVSDGETCAIALKESGNSSNKKGILEYTIDGYKGTFQTTFTVSTETKKPTLVLSAKTDTLYPELGYWDSWLSVTDKTTGEPVQLNGASVGVQAQLVFKKEAAKKIPVTEFTDNVFDSGDSYATFEGNNSYRLLITPDGNIVSKLVNADSYSTKKDTLNLELQKANWASPITVSYKLSVSTQKPKLVLGSSKLSLNMNEEVYLAQMARTSLQLKGYNSSIGCTGDDWVSITGADDKSKRALKVDNSIVVQYWDDSGDVIVRFNKYNYDKVTAGTYKFVISVGNNEIGTYASATLAVSVKDSPAAKNLKVSAKGTIDVLNRTNTYIAYTPKLSNLSGEIADGWLEGRDADKFDAWMENGKLVVYAKDGYTYSTNVKYQVEAVFRVHTEDYNDCEIRTSSPLVIKLKQGKPKLKATTANNTLYRQLGNSVSVELDAVLSQQIVEIEDVWLTNYTEDLWLDSGSGRDEESGMINTVNIGLEGSASSILKSGKTWTVKLGVRYRDRAGNEKNDSVTCKIVVK